MVVAIANQKGGAGKTTTAIALAAGLTAKRRKTLIIDMDAQGNTTDTTGADTAGATIFNVLIGEANAAEVIQNAGGFGDVIPAHERLSNADRYLADMGREAILKSALAPILERYEYIIIDTPPSLGVLTANALTAATGIIVPAGADKYGLKGIRQLRGTVEAVRTHTNPALQIYGILLTRHDPRRILLRDYHDGIAELAAEMGTRVFERHIRDCTAIREAQAVKQTVFDYAPNCTAAEDYAAFVIEFLKKRTGKHGKAKA